ncbi:hypothetical protein LP415_23060 [Polaromonas sp. P1(28)-8]|nr:hypothetical protein LP415_23060 [Polaromonas sp. P1(28)-8]
MPWPFRLPVPAAGGGGGVRLQRRALPRPTLARLHAGLVFGSKAGRTGLFSDGPLLASLWTSVVVAGWVTLLAVLVGTTNAF